MDYNEVLDFWFGELKPEHWWRKDENLDRLIADRFLGVHTAAARCELYAWRLSPQGRLAEMIVHRPNIEPSNPRAWCAPRSHWGCTWGRCGWRREIARRRVAARARLYAPDVVSAINALNLPRYGLANYVAATPHRPPTPAEARQLQDLSRAGKRLMGFCRARARQLLADGDLRRLFIDALGWDHYTTPVDITIDGSFLTLSALAHKRGMVAYRYTTPSAQPLPNYALRRKIEHQVAKAVHEHLIIFTDAANHTQIWQWVKHEPGKPAACREHTFHRSQRGDALLQKIERITFMLEEEEALSLPGVTGRARAAFDVERVTRRFYDRFQEEHRAFLRFVEGITEQGDREWYASVMLNRLMFVYFIQRKGFLDGDRDYLRNRLNRMRAEHGRDTFYTFYRYFLLRLFHEGLGGSDDINVHDIQRDGAGQSTQLSWSKRKCFPRRGR